MELRILQMLIFPLCCNAVQSEKCNFTVRRIQSEEKFLCFETMKGQDPVCRSGHSTPSCQIEYRDGITCIKGPTSIDLNCVDESMLKTEMLNEEKECASDQQSISCNGEYKSEPRNSGSTMSMSLPLITVCVVGFIHWMSLLDC